MPQARRLPPLLALAMLLALLPIAAYGEENGGDNGGDGSQSSHDACPAASFADRDSIPEAHVGNVDCAAAAGIAQGFSDNTYRPGAPVLRDGMASFIARALQAADVNLPAPDSARFADVGAGSAHDDAIHRLKAAGIVGGGPGGLPATHYGPRLGVRRDQMASFLIRALEFAQDQELGSSSQRFPDVGSGNPHFANVNAAGEQGLAQGRADGRYGPGDAVRRDQMASFLVRALEALGASQAATVGASGMPPAPRSVGAENESTAAEGRVKVSWDALDDPHGRVTGFNVYYGEGDTNTHAGSGTTTVPAGATAYTVGGLALDVEYTFAVTVVTNDGLESPKSAEVTTRTLPPGVRITEPTSQAPAAVAPSATVQLSFEASTADGGSYQVAYREGDADWTPFPETPDGSPGQIPAGAGTRTTTVTGPSETGTYDLRVVVTPNGGTAAIQDVAGAALQVVTEPGDPTVVIDQPTSSKQAQVETGEDVTVKFTASDAGEYVLSIRPTGEDWDEDESGDAAEGQNTTTIDAPPAPGDYDLRVVLTTADGKTAQHVQSGSVVVTGGGGDPCDEDPDLPECNGNGGDPCDEDPELPECNGNGGDPCDEDPDLPECNGNGGEGLVSDVSEELDDLLDDDPPGTDELPDATDGDEMEAWWKENWPLPALFPDGPCFGIGGIGCVWDHWPE